MTIEAMHVSERSSEWTIRHAGRSFTIRRVEATPDDDPALDANLIRSWHLETWPGTSAAPEEVWRERIRLRPLPPHIHWLVSDEAGKTVGSSRFVQHSPSVAWLSLYIDANSRRHRIATAVIADALDTAKRAGASTFHVGTASTIPAGEHFVQRLNATLCHTASFRELPVTPSDPSTRGETRAIPGESDIRLEIRTGPCPEEWLNSYAGLLHSIGVAYENPTNESLEEQREAVRRLEYSLDRSRIQRWMICAVINEELVGVSQYLWDPYEPEVMTEDGMAVVDTHRRRRIPYLFSRRLPAVLQALPSVRAIRIKSLARTPGGLARSLLSAPKDFHHSESTWRVEV